MGEVVACMSLGNCVTSFPLVWRLQFKSQAIRKNRCCVDRLRAPPIDIPKRARVRSTQSAGQNLDHNLPDGIP